MSAPAKSISSMQTRTVVANGQHNAFTDLAFWRDRFWLVYVSSPGHFASTSSRIVLLRSTDAREWQEVARFSGDGQDIRDPKLAVIHDRLILFALLDKKFDPQPYQTICATSADGKTWSRFAKTVLPGWLFGKPKTFDGVNWYAPAHNLAFKAARLFRSQDGVQWEAFTAIDEQQRADETALAFDANGNLVTVTRLESGSGIFGDVQGGTLVSIAQPPYERWKDQTTSSATRLDGPTLFVHKKTWAVGRFQPQVRSPFQGHGSIFSRKRTAIFSVNGTELVHRADLPSSGDTAYAGVVLDQENLFISYYTNDPRYDLPWIVGMFRPTQIQMTRISLAALEPLENSNDE